MMNEDALIARATLEPIVHRFRWNAHGHLDVFVSKEHHAACNRIAFGWHWSASYMTHPHDFALDILGLRRVDRLPSRDLRWRVNVIQRRRRSDEAFGSKNLFAIECAVRTAKLNVALRR